MRLRNGFQRNMLRGTYSPRWWEIQPVKTLTFKSIRYGVNRRRKRNILCVIMLNLSFIILLFLAISVVACIILPHE